MSQVNSPPLHLDIVSDTICPWCYVGKRRLAEALPVLAAEGLHFEITWRPFQLNPDMPREGVDRREYRITKFGSWERSQALDARVAEAGAGAGLIFRHDLMRRTPNTLASHALVRLAHEVGGAAVQDRAVEALFAAHFTEGRDVGDARVLADIAEATGINRARAAEYLAEPSHLNAVATEERQARRLGLDGVPSFVLNGYFLFSGAQSGEVFVRALRQAAAHLMAAGAAPAPA